MTPSLPRLLRRSRSTWLAAASRSELPRFSSVDERRPRWDPIVVWPVLGSLRSAVAIVVVGVLFAMALDLLPISDPRVPGDILATIWQVQAGILGLAVAVAVFAYQSLGPGRGSRRRLILLTSFPASMISGVAIVLLTGAAYLGGSWSWAMWLGVVAIGFTGGWICLLLPTIALAPHLQDHRYAMDMRMRALRINVRSTVERLVLSRASRVVLVREMAASGGVFGLWVEATGIANRVTSDRSGVVADFSLVRLRHAAEDIGALGGKLEVAIRIGLPIAKGTPISGANVEIPDAVRKSLLSGLVMESVQGPSLEEDLSDLHDDAMASVETSPDIVDEVLNAYRSVLEEYAIGWRSYTGILGADHLPGWAEGFEAPTKSIKDSILKLFRKSLDTRSIESAQSLSYFPVAVLSRAIDWLAPGYFEFVTLAPGFYWLASQTNVADDMRHVFRERSWSNLVDALQWIIPQLEREADEQRRLLTADAKEELQKALFSVFRAAVREDDFDNFREGIRRWRLANR
jgi:hypothetical protein